MDTLSQLRDEVCQSNLDLVSHGLVTLTWGNVSGLSNDGEVFAIKPSGVDYRALRAADVVVVSVKTGEVVDGRLKPSSDAPTHRVLYERFAGIGGVAHTHSFKATTFAQALREIPCFGTTHADHFYGAIPVTRKLTQAEIAGNYEVATGLAIVERFADLDPTAMPAVLVAGHAPFTWGKNAADAVKNAVALEAVAEMALGTYALCKDAQPVDQYLLDKHYFRKHGKGAYYGQPGA